MSTHATEMLVFAAILVGGAVASLGGLLLYWTVAANIAFRRRGYRIRQLPPRELLWWTPGPKPYVYEERGDNGLVRSLPFIRVVVEGGYPASSSAHFPGELHWAAEVPEWARERRVEILERVDRLLGKGSMAQPPS